MRIMQNWGSSFDKFYAVLHYSFIEDSLDERKEVLVENWFQNIKIEHKILKNAHAKEIVKMNRVEITFRKVLLDVKANREMVFHALDS